MTYSRPMKLVFCCTLFSLLLISSCKQDGIQVVPSANSDATTSTLAGSTSGFADGQGTSAKFAAPHGIAVDNSGNIYVADNANQKIRKISSTGFVTTLAGSVSGNLDGVGTGARFNYPEGIAVDASGNVYVADTENHSIRKITPTGAVTTLAGSTSGYADGQGANAMFSFPQGVVVDGSGNVYVSDTENYKIRKITPAGVVTTIAGSTEGFSDGTGANAQFTFPTYIAINSNNTLYVADSYKIRQISSGGVVTTLAGSSTSGYADGVGTAARFTNPNGVAVDSGGNIYVSDTDNNRIRKITSSGTVTTIAGSLPGFADGIGPAGQFNSPIGITVDASRIMYVADANNNKIRKILFP